MDPLTALTLLSMANNTFKLFSKDGGGKIQEMEMEMLMLISKQLVVIQQGIELTLVKLDELKKLVDSVPEKTVIELYKSECRGYINLFHERMEGFIIERNKNGLVQAKNIFEPKILTEVLEPLTSRRAKILTYYDIMQIPIICTVLHTEIQAMIMTKQPNSIIQPALNSYLEWFETVSSTIPERINTKREIVKLELEKVNSLSLTSTCVVKKDSTRRGGGNSQSPSYYIQYGTFKHVDVKYSVINCLTLDSEIEAANPLISSNIIFRDDLPKKLKQEVLKEVLFGGLGSGKRGDQKSYSSQPDIIANNQVDKFLEDNPKCPIDIKNEIPANKISYSLEQSGYSILCYGALLMSANEAIKGIEMYQRDLN